MLVSYKMTISILAVDKHWSKLLQVTDIIKQLFWLFWCDCTASTWVPCEHVVVKGWVKPFRTACHILMSVVVCCSNESAMCCTWKEVVWVPCYLGCGNSLRKRVNSVQPRLPWLFTFCTGVALCTCRQHVFYWCPTVIEIIINRSAYFSYWMQESTCKIIYLMVSNCGLKATILCDFMCNILNSAVLKVSKWCLSHFTFHFHTDNNVLQI
jgi:hypothetical protein